MAGWISLHRSITKHWLWECEEFSKSQAWIDLILHACHKPNSLMIKGKLYKLERGQQARSMLTLSKKWKWSRGKVKRFLDALIDDSMIVQQTDINTSIISICNYDSFQDNDATNEHQTVQQTNTKQDNGQGTNNKVNKVNNDNKCSKIDFDSVLDSWNSIASESDKLSSHKVIPEKVKRDLPKTYKKYKDICKREGKEVKPIEEWVNGYFGAVSEFRGCWSDNFTKKTNLEYACRIDTYDKVLEWAHND